MKDLTVTFQLP